MTEKEASNNSSFIEELLRKIRYSQSREDKVLFYQDFLKIVPNISFDSENLAKGKITGKILVAEGKNINFDFNDHSFATVDIYDNHQFIGDWLQALARIIMALESTGSQWSNYLKILIK